MYQISGFRLRRQHDRGMTVPGSRCNTKILRPERCEVFDGKPCAACTEDIELEKEIGELERSIEKLQSKRRALRTVMNENHDHLLHKFPPEIISLIFIRYAPPSAHREKKKRSTPLRLGAVCRKWRQLAWATPQLWSSLVVQVTDPGEDAPRLITEWLERSASLPLTIRYDHSYVEQAEVTNILNKHSAWWYDMYLDIPVYHLHHLGGSSQENILRRLTLRHSPAILAVTRSNFSMTTKPRLTHLKLLTVSLSCVDIIWDNLTVASVYDIGVDECFELIRRAPLLRTLRLHKINSSSGVYPVPNTRIVHSHLQSLELSVIKERSVFVGILDSLCLPLLEQWLYDYCSLPLGVLETMISFIGYLPCLKIFKINIDHFTRHQVIELLSHLSFLESLELRTNGRSYPIKELVDLLFNATQSPLFLPHLQSLEFVCRYSFPWESLPQIFASSRGQSLMVKVSTLSGGHDILDKTERLLVELVDEGFNLSIGEIEEYREEWHH